MSLTHVPSKARHNLWRNFCLIVNGILAKETTLPFSILSLLMEHILEDFALIGARFELGCFQRKRRDIVIALASSSAAVASSSAVALCENFDIF